MVGPGFIFDFDNEMWLREALHLASCVGMMNVTNHLLTPKGQAFALSPITLLPPAAVFSLPLYPVDCLYLVEAVVVSLVHQQIPRYTTMHFPCLQSSVRLFPLPHLSFQKYLLFGHVPSEIHLCCECD